MPLYEYECTHCHYQTEILQKMNSEPETHCPKCSRETLTRLVSASRFQLKGTGWYVTDFKNKDKPKPISEHNTQSNIDTPKETPKPETSKPESKAE